jgi:arylsulfatase A-like enzyme
MRNFLNIHVVLESVTLRFQKESTFFTGWTENWVGYVGHFSWDNCLARGWMLRFAMVICWCWSLPLCGGEACSPARPPNFVVVFADDLGYGDVGRFGSKLGVTPHLDRMASEGMRFTDFYVSQAVCSSSRAALLTGCYANRVGIQGALGPNSRTGLARDEDTIADILKRAGYATAIFGKWHLGDDETTLPAAQGFDEYLGLPYSNDMWPFHPTSKAFPDLPLVEGVSIKKKRVTAEDQKNLTRWYTERAIDFIDRNVERPFFLYVPHSMPHVPLYASENFEGKTGKGLYADVIAEIDWSVGTILERLKKHGLDDNTLVIFTSDNGPWLSYGPHAGSAGPLREGKGTTWEGGVRVPCIMRWPGKIPADRACAAITATIDILPTIAHLANCPLPEKPIDGDNITTLMMGNAVDWEKPRTYHYYWGEELQAVRQGTWKLHFPHKYRTLNGTVSEPGQPAPYREEKTDLALFNLVDDVGETQDLASRHPEIVSRLKNAAELMRKQLGDSLTGEKGTANRPAAKVRPTN